MDYKELIIELLEKVGNEKFLKRIYISLREFVRESRENGGTE